MYNLYFNKNHVVLKLEKVRNQGSQLQKDYPTKPMRFNDCYYFCTTREPLKVLKQKIKEQWLEDAKRRLEEIKAL